MNQKIANCILLLLMPALCFAQTYKFNRQSIIKYKNERTQSNDTWVIPIEVEVTQDAIILRRPSNGTGEKPLCDTLIRAKTIINKHFKKIITKDDRCVIIWSDYYITMCTKEVKGSRVEYCFYNQEKE